MNFELSKSRKDLLETKGNILVLGGPGSGKTTIALLKADRIITDGLKNDQFILFLSFARSTIARVEQHAKINLLNLTQNQLEINTYHGFTWNLLKAHGYLLNRHYPFHLLPPPEAATHLADFEDSLLKEKEKLRLFEEEGILHFDLFAELSAQLLSKSKKLAKILSDAYPVIILDEFQDTNKAEWDFIKTLGEKSTLIALADPEQRIYEFRGADPARIGEFIKEYEPSVFDFGNENNRSNGTDIVKFGNDLLSGNNKSSIYNDVSILKYSFRQGLGIHLDLKLEVLKARKRLIASDTKNWSLAILVPSKNLMLSVSAYLDSNQLFNNGTKLTQISHEVALETSGPSLAAVLIAGLMETSKNDISAITILIGDLINHIRGRNGDKPPNKNKLSLSQSLSNYLRIGKFNGKICRTVVEACGEVIVKCKENEFSGRPGDDWIRIRDILLASKSEDVRLVGQDALYLRLLHKGAILNSSLATLWKEKYTYKGARNAVRDALLQEHFSSSTKVWSGIHVMTMHKAKGKEFNEVIIYEGLYQGKIVRKDADQKETAQALLTLRVAVTRAMQKVNILTPKTDVCKFLS